MDDGVFSFPSWQKLEKNSGDNIWPQTFIGKRMLKSFQSDFLLGWCHTALKGRAPV